MLELEQIFLFFLYTSLDFIQFFETFLLGLITIGLTIIRILFDNS